MKITEKILITPPLECLAKNGADGLIREISPSELRIEWQWDSQFPQENAPPVMVEIIYSGQVFEISLSNRPGNVTSRDFFYTPLAEHDLRKVSELMGLIRKRQHIDICQFKDVEASDHDNGLAKLHFIPTSLPELNYDEIDVQTTFLGRDFAYPFLISGMTGGVDKGEEINRRLAMTAAQLGIPMGVGSQRVAIEQDSFSSIFRAKQWAPNLFLIGNIGGSQLLRPNFKDICSRAVEMIDANALAIHLNVLQELIQVEGDRVFRGILKNLQVVCQSLGVPVIVKEVGTGISPETAIKLYQCGISALDIAGKGGTSWSYVEGLRSSSPETRDIGRLFRDWGIPTAYSLRLVKQRLPELPVIASGGIRDGMMAAKALGLGAKLVGIGLPLLRAALVSDEEPINLLRNYIRGLKITMLATGCKTTDQLKNKLTFGVAFEREFNNSFTR